MSAIATIADLVVTALNGHAFSETFTAERGWAPLVPLERTIALTVRVAPRSSRVAERLTRRADRLEHTVDITLLKQTDETNADVDVYVGLAEEVADLFRRETLAGPYPCVGIQTDPVCALSELNSRRLITSVVSLTFQEVRAAA